MLPLTRATFSLDKMAAGYIFGEHDQTGSVISHAMALRPLSVAGFATICVSLLPFFQTARFRAFRASLFAALGLWGIAPGLHALLLHMDEPYVQAAFQLDILMGAVYLVSPVALKLPSRE